MKPPRCLGAILIVAVLPACLLVQGCQAGKKEANRTLTAAEEERASAAEEEAQEQLQKKDFTAAVAPLAAIGRLHPEAYDVFDMLGMCVMRARNQQDLLKQAREDLQKNPQDPVALTIAANALRGRDNEKERLTYLRRLNTLRAEDQTLRLTLAQELVNANLYAEARPHLDLLIEQGAKEALPYYLRGKVTLYEATTPETLAQAEGDLKEALQRNPGMSWAHLFLGRVYAGQKKPQAAIEQLKTAVSLMPGNPDPLFELARAYRSTGNKAQADKAEAAFSRLRQQDLKCVSLVTRCGAFPRDFDLHLKTATALMEKGDLEQSMVFAQRALVLRPGDARANALIQKLSDRLRAGG